MPNMLPLVIPKIFLTGYFFLNSMAGVTTGNVEYLANAIHEVTKSSEKELKAGAV
jgi:hypothetical protein